MLEKKEGVINATKLRVILLLEVDFNVINTIIFNTRLIPIIEKLNLILNKLIDGYRAQSTIQLVVNKKLIADVANQ